MVTYCIIQLYKKSSLSKKIKKKKIQKENKRSKRAKRMQKDLLEDANYGLESNEAMIWGMLWVNVIRNCVSFP